MEVRGPGLLEKHHWQESTQCHIDYCFSSRFHTLINGSSTSDFSPAFLFDARDHVRCPLLGNREFHFAVHSELIEQ